VTPPIRPGERDALIRSLRAGTVPRAGQRHVQVGRAAEATAMTADLDRVAGGGSAVRFVVGESGAGKTFFMHLVRSLAMERRLVTVHAGLAPDRRLHATGGQARALYAELTRNTATRASPGGGALPAVVERFVSSAVDEARQAGADPGEVIRSRLAHLSELPGGHDFTEVAVAYWRGHDLGDEHLKAAALRWLRAGYADRAEARSALGVRSVIDDSGVHDHLKLMALLARQAGYGGLLVCLDELAGLARLPGAGARESNYGEILRIVDDTLRGTAAHLGFLFCATPDFLTDGRRGLYSHQALRSLLVEHSFATGGPVLRLEPLTPEDLYVLLAKIRYVHASGDAARYLVNDDALVAFMHHCQERAGDACFRMPRATIKAFCELLAVLQDDPRADWRQLLPGVRLPREPEPGPLGDGLAPFGLRR
jgi:hypothetical protein